MPEKNLKAEFLQTLLDRTRLWSYVRRADKALRKLRKTEDVIGKDASAYSEEDAREMFGLLHKASRFTVLHFARQYVRWCVENDVDGVCAGILGFRPDDLEETRLEMTANPLGLQSVLDEVYGPESDRTVSNVYRCLAWCAFSGIPYEDALALTADNIDFPAGLIRTEGGEYPLYAESVPAFRVACESTWFYSDHPNHNHVVRERSEGDLLLRGILAGVSYVDMTRRFVGDFKKARKNGKTESRIKYETLLKSGMFFRVSELETENSPADLSGEVRRRIENLNSKHDDAASEERGADDERSTVIENIMYEEYYRWKLAFLPE